MVILNTVVYVQSEWQRSASDVPFGLSAFGFGSMPVALLLPRLPNDRSDRQAMLTGAAIMTAGLTFGMALTGLAPAVEWPAFLLTWLVIGMGYSMTHTPSGRLLRGSALSADCPAVFAAQFSLSHACWLITYPLAKQIGARFGLTAAFATLAAISALGVLAAWRFWPANDPDVIEHHHAEGDTAHLAEGDRTCATSHRHVFTMDDEHPRWPDSR